MQLSLYLNGPLLVQKYLNSVFVSDAPSLVLSSSVSLITSCEINLCICPLTVSCDHCPIHVLAIFRLDML